MGGSAECPPRTHPKTGERRHVRRTLRFDQLPEALLKRIRAERAAGRTWAAIEQDSPQWPEWEQVAPEACADFPQDPEANLRGKAVGQNRCRADDIFASNSSPASSWSDPQK